MSFISGCKKQVLCEQQKNTAANVAAARERELFAKDKQISHYYNDTLANGKWSHMMDQTHIGYTYWQQPNVDKMPEVTEINPDSAKTNQPYPVLSGSYTDYLAIESDRYDKAIGENGITWKVIRNYGNTSSGVTPWPVTAARVKPMGNSPRLEYDISLKDTGTVTVTAYISPSLDFRNKDGLYYAVSIDNEEPQLVNIATKVDSPEWGMAVSDNIRKMVTKHHIAKAGAHTLKYWMVDPAVVLQRLVIDNGGLKPSYLGPPENWNMLPPK